MAASSSAIAATIPPMILPTSTLLWNVAGGAAGMSVGATGMSVGTGDTSIGEWDVGMATPEEELVEGALQLA